VRIPGEDPVSPVRGKSTSVRIRMLGEDPHAALWRCRRLMPRETNPGEINLGEDPKARSEGSCRGSPLRGAGSPVRG